MHAHADAYTHIHTHSRMHADTHIHTHTHAHEGTHIHAHAHAHTYRHMFSNTSYLEKCCAHFKNKNFLTTYFSILFIPLLRSVTFTIHSFSAEREKCLY